MNEVMKSRLEITGKIMEPFHAWMDGIVKIGWII